MSEKELPFYTKAALLDRYIKDIDPDNDAEIIKVILDVLQKKEDLRRYFFRNRPSPKWAKIFWDNLFFESPPPPVIQEGEVVALPPWDVQYYLIEIATEVPEIVLKHVQTVEAAGWYKSQALRALVRLHPSEAVRAVDRINQWLNTEDTAGSIGEETYEYVILMIEGGYIDAAFNIFKELTKPRLISKYQMNLRQRAAYEPIFNIYFHILEKDYNKVNAFSELVINRTENMARLLIDQLGEALRLEGEANKNSKFDRSSWWRIAVEETGQDGVNSTKDYLLKLLLQNLEYWANTNFQEFQPILYELLGDNRAIFYRIGLYLLQKYSDRIPLVVVNELGKYENLDNTEIRHEYFLLLANGFQYMPLETQSELVTFISNGPAEEQREKIRSYYSPEMKLSQEEYFNGRCDVWIRDRLWMIQGYLEGKPKAILAELVNKYGQPEHPTFHSYLSGGGFEKSVSPIPAEDIKKFTSQELIAFIEKWEPSKDQGSFFQERNYEGLGQVIANATYENTEYYRTSISTIARTHPEISSAIIERFIKAEKITIIQWEILLDLCEHLLNDEEIRTSMKAGHEPNWPWTRLCIVSLINSGFVNNNHSLSKTYWTKARDILLILINDPDPNTETEPKPELGEEFSVNDPLTLSLNHIRPTAIRALIEYASYRARRLRRKDKLEEEVTLALSRKLDVTHDASLAVRSVFGTYLPRLYWLNSKWVEKNIDNIFPEIVDQESLWFFQAAWDAYIFNKPFYTDLRDLLLPKYLVAIETLASGFVTRKDVVGTFANHLAYDLMLGKYNDDFLTDELIPLVRFFKKTSPEDRAKGALALSIVCEKYPDKLGEWWPKVRKVWEWRVQEGITENHSSDFDPEMRNFASLLKIAPVNESIVSLWPLLEGMLPHIVNIQFRDMGWDHIERFLANQVKTYPLESIQLYRMMREQRRERYSWHQETDEAKIIINTAVTNPNTREETLSLIDLLASLGNYEYQEIYNRYSN